MIEVMVDDAFFMRNSDYMWICSRRESQENESESNLQVAPTYEAKDLTRTGRCGDWVQTLSNRSFMKLREAHSCALCANIAIQVDIFAFFQFLSTRS